MNEHVHDLPLPWWANNFEELDREIARLAMVCGVPILEPGIVQRVLQRDASVCRSENPAAFSRLHDLLMLHFIVRSKSVDLFGQSQTKAVEDYVVQRLKAHFQLTR